MQTHREPADEPYESRDLALGSVVQCWADQQTGAVDLELGGPLEAPGMDPTWSLELRGEAFEALVHLFYGPIANVTLVRLDGELYVGGAQDFSPRQLVSMLDDLMAAGHDGVIPTWLRTLPEAGGPH